ncbi:MAG: PorT family protein [Bacteroidota bacterium]|nr:PorT family protein [Bacteroidota bacterium]
MKKLALSLLFAATIISTSWAQEDEDQVFHFGLKASPSVNWFRIEGDNVKNEALRLGFTYGLITEFRITQNYAFATGLDISYRGGKYSEVKLLPNNTGVGALVTLDRIQRFQFVEVPISLKLKTNEIGYMKYYGTFGVLPGVLVKATEDVESGDKTRQPDRSKRGNQSDFAAFNLSLQVGLGIEYNLGGNTSLTAGIHYVNGLIDIWDRKDLQMRSDGIVLNIGVFF